MSLKVTNISISQGYEDWLRHIADNEVNHRQTTVIRDGVALTKCKAMDIKVKIHFLNYNLLKWIIITSEYLLIFKMRSTDKN